MARHVLAGRRRFGLFSLTQRVLLVNLIAVILLGSGMLYIDRYEHGLIETELAALATQGEIFAGALAEGAVLEDVGETPVLVPSLSQGMMRRLVEPTRIRARLFMPNHSLVADSSALEGPGGRIQVMVLAPPDDAASRVLPRLVETLSSLVRSREHYPPYIDLADPHAEQFPEVLHALDGRVDQAVRSNDVTGGLVLSVAVPVRRYKQVLGAVQLSVGSADLESQVNSVRSEILKLFALCVGVSTLLSLYLARTIARPVRQLAQAAHEVRHGSGRQVAIPDFSRRRDEIGELSVALTEMTSALWRRMDAIERFAADVAHEIKNPLTSLRSAVETAARIEDPEKQRRLMAIIHDDVQRLDRLISDISDASRLDAEMSRLELAPVALAGMLATLIDVHDTTRKPDAPALTLTLVEPGDPLTVQGKEGRLVQVLRNLINNAVSFTPPGGTIRLSARRQDKSIVVTVDDDGPGIPESKLEAIFDRFYSERPAGEKFGTHSGLGLAISKQIIEAHGGKISALNRIDAAGAVIGARFVLRLPRAPE